MGTGPLEVIATLSLAALAVRVAKPMWRYVTRPVGTVRAVRTPEPHVVLTYDDGPDPLGTPAIANALGKFGATATFFMLVPRVRQHLSLVQDLMAAGHEIGLHGLDHTRLTSLSPAETHRRCQTGRDELEQLLGTAVRWFRAPYGALLPPHWVAVRRAGLTPVAWGPTPGDWRHLPEEELAAQVVNSVVPGDIMLAHDGFAVLSDGANDGPPPQIDRGRLTDLVLSGLATRGLVGRSLTDALAFGDVRKWAWFVR